MTATADCPVCGGASRPLLSLAAQPIYQHPVAADAFVPPPHAVDLAWVACADCAHAWQPAFDAELLERIYRQHYYTPAPDGLAVQFRNDFVSALKELGLLGPRRVVVEIGASDGGLLAEIQSKTAAGRAVAFEPDARNAALARGRGLEVREQFFGSRPLREHRKLADLVYARHVIEHVFDFADFFAGLDAIALPAADLLFETPSLDHHAGTSAVTPFHVEHVHVFSGRSLAALAQRQGWQLSPIPRHCRRQPDRKFRTGCRRREARSATRRRRSPHSAGSRRESTATAPACASSSLAGRLVFWGAGSAAIRLASTIGRAPDHWTDGNPAKVGKKFIGFDTLIEAPADALAAATAAAGSGAVVVIASSFVREILPTVRKLGWRGETLDLGGNRL